MTASIAERFLFTVGANLLRGLLSLVTGMLLARLLGPRSYGDLAFLMGTFLGLRQMLDLGSSSAFFTFLSQRSRSRRFVWSFFGWLAVQFFVPLGVIGLIFPSRWVSVIWHGEPRGLVLLAFAAAFLQHSVWPVIQQAGESQRQTVRVQAVGVAVAAAHLLAVVLLWRLGFLGLYAIFAAIALEYLAAAMVAHSGFEYSLPGAQDADDGDHRTILRRYASFCLPLVLYSVVGFAYEFADRWLLQRFGGGVQQAYYAVGAQFASVALIATSAILRILWKEVAEAHHSGDQERAGRLYRRVSRLLFVVGAAIAGFLIPWAEEVVPLLLGTAYASGAGTLAIMFLYPVHQSMGQIGGTMLYATERVSLQVTVGVVFMLAGILASYVVLAPPGGALPGLSLGSEGLALKMVGLQLIHVNVIAYLIARIWKWPFEWGHQPLSLAVCLGLGWSVHRIVSGLGAAPALILAAAALYALILGTLLSASPWLIGLAREDLADLTRRLPKIPAAGWGSA